MKLVYLRDIMQNQEVAEIMDWWHSMAQYEIYLNGKYLYRLDLQEPYEDMNCFSTLTLAEHWCQRLEDRQSSHLIDEFKENERKQIEALKTFIEQEKLQSIEPY